MLRSEGGLGEAVGKTCCLSVSCVRCASTQRCTIGGLLLRAIWMMSGISATTQHPAAIGRRCQVASRPIVSTISYTGIRRLHAHSQFLKKWRVWRGRCTHRCSSTHHLSGSRQAETKRNRCWATPGTSPPAQWSCWPRSAVFACRTCDCEARWPPKKIACALLLTSSLCFRRWACLQNFFRRLTLLGHC